MRKKRVSHYKSKESEPSLSKVCSLNSFSFSLIILKGNIVKRVEKSYVDTLYARKPLDFN